MKEDMVGAFEAMVRERNMFRVWVREIMDLPEKASKRTDANLSEERKANSYKKNKRILEIRKGCQALNVVLSDRNDQVERGTTQERNFVLDTTLRNT